MPIKLKHLLIDRVDLVGKGDNPEAHIALFKRKQEEEEEEPTWVKKILDTINKRNRKEGDGNIMFDFQKFLKDLKDEALEARVSALPADVQKGLGEAIEQVAEEERNIDAMKGLVEKAEMTSETDRLKARIAQLEQQLAEAKKSAPEAEDVMKGLPEAVQKLLKDAQDRAEAAEKIAKETKDAQEVAKFVAIAKGMPSIVTVPDKVGPVLKRIADNSQEDFQAIEAVLKAANALLEENNLLLKEVGAAGEGSSTGTGSAWDQIEKEAKDLMKSDSSLTHAKAIRKAMDNNPSLYKQYQKELTEEEV